MNINRFIRPFVISLSFAVVAFMLYDAINPLYDFSFTNQLHSPPTVVGDTSLVTPSTTIGTEDNASLSKEDREPTTTVHQPPSIDDFKSFNYKALIFSIAVFIGVFGLLLNAQIRKEERRYGSDG